MKNVSKIYLRDLIIKDKKPNLKVIQTQNINTNEETIRTYLIPIITIRIFNNCQVTIQTLNLNIFTKIMFFFLKQIKK